MFLIYFYSEEKIVRLKRCFVCCNLKLCCIPVLSHKFYYSIRLLG